MIFLSQAVVSLRRHAKWFWFVCWRFRCGARGMQTGNIQDLFGLQVYYLPVSSVAERYQVLFLWRLCDVVSITLTLITYIVASLGQLDKVL